MCKVLIILVLNILVRMEEICVRVVMDLDTCMLNIADGQSESQYQQTYKAY